MQATGELSRGQTAALDKLGLERKERLAARYTRDKGLLDRIAPYERSREYYAAQGLDLGTTTAERKGVVSGDSKHWWDLLSLETTSTTGSQAAANGRVAATELEQQAAAAARVRAFSEAYRAYWRGLSIQQKAAEKEEAGAYVRKFLSAIVEGIRGEPPEQVGTHSAENAVDACCHYTQSASCTGLKAHSVAGGLWRCHRCTGYQHTRRNGQRTQWHGGRVVSTDDRRRAVLPYSRRYYC